MIIKEATSSFKWGLKSEPKPWFSKQWHLATDRKFHQIIQSFEALVMMLATRVFKSCGVSWGFFTSESTFQKVCKIYNRWHWRSKLELMRHLRPQSHFSMSKISRIVLKFFFIEEYKNRRTTFINDIFW